MLAGFLGIAGDRRSELRPGIALRLRELLGDQLPAVAARRAFEDDEAGAGFVGPDAGGLDGEEGFPRRGRQPDEAEAVEGEGAVVEGDGIGGGELDGAAALGEGGDAVLGAVGALGADQVGDDQVGAQGAVVGPGLDRIHQRLDRAIQAGRVGCEEEMEDAAEVRIAVPARTHQASAEAPERDGVEGGAGGPHRQRVASLRREPRPERATALELPCQDLAWRKIPPRPAAESRRQERRDDDGQGARAGNAEQDASPPPPGEAARMDGE